MTFLDRLTKGVGKAAEQAKFEAEKLVRVNKLSSEVSDLASQVERATAAIGTKVMELHKSGGLQVPGVDDLIQRVEALQAQLVGKQAELDKAKAGKFEEVAPAAQPAAPATAAAPEGKFCPDCGAGIQPGAKFCPSCGQKIG